MSALFYRAVIQEVLIFGSESWALSNAMVWAVEGTHMGFLRQITVKQARRQSEGSLETPVAEEFLRVSGMQSVAKYFGHRQAVVAQWVDLDLLLEVYVRETCYG